MLRPPKVSAVIVTRGDVDLTPVLESLIFDDVVVWDNSKEDVDQMTYGRVLALERAKYDVIYSQDDDIVHSRDNQIRIVYEGYQPGMLTGCMWPEWSAAAEAQGIENGYEDLVFCGSGSVYDKSVPRDAVSKYLAVYPEDNFFRLWCDTLVGVIAPINHLPIHFEALPFAEDDNRMCNLPDAVSRKTQAIWRGRQVRDRALVAA